MQVSVGLIRTRISRYDPRLTAEKRAGFRNETGRGSFKETSARRLCPRSGWRQNAKTARLFEGQTNFSPDNVRPPTVVEFLKCHDRSPACLPGVNLSTKHAEEFRYTIR